MKTCFKSAGLTLLAGLALAGCARSGEKSIHDPAIAARLKSFAAEKENQARSLASADGKELPSNFEAFFSAVENGDWEEATNDFAEMKSHIASDKALYGSWWQPVLETFGAAEQFSLGDEKYAAAYGNDIIQSIPPGSIYLGGTDPGRFIVTMMQKSQADGDPFFGLSQNPLTDATYLDYLRSIYSGKVYIPTTNDWQKCFDDYFRDFQKRQATHQLQPGESVTNGPDGKMQVNSYMSLLQVRSLLAKMVFDQNTGREFYVEVSFPLEWMYPYLEPHGLIFKLNHEPVAELTNDAIQRDHDYWTNTVAPMIGDWLTDDTTVTNIAAFAEKVYLQQDFDGFNGDTAFVENAQSCRMFSKERLSIAMLYAWRAQYDADAADKQRMDAAADFAFRQAWALCPDSPEAVFSYATFLQTEKRFKDELAVAETAQKFRSGPGVGTIDQFVTALKNSRVP